MAWQLIVDDNFTNANTSTGAAGTTTGVPTQGGWTDVLGSTWNILSNKLQGVSVTGGFNTAFLVQNNSGIKQDQRIVIDIDPSAGGTSSQQVPIAVVRYQTSTKACYFANCDFKTNSLYLFSSVGIVLLGSPAAFTYIAGHAYQLELIATGVSPTTLTANLYDTSSGTPTTPVATISTTDSTAALQTAGSYAITNTNDSSTGNLLLTRVRTYQPPAATALAFSGAPSTLTVGVPSPITVSANGPLASNVTVTLSDSGAGGTFSPTTLTLTSSTLSGSFTYAPVATGNVTLTTSNTGSLTNPSGTIGVNPQYLLATNMVAAPYTFKRIKDGSSRLIALQTNCQGAYFKFAFTGSTKVGLFVDVSSQLAASADPTNIKLRVSVNGGPTTDFALPATSGELVFATGLTTGTTYTCHVTFVTMVESIDRWVTPVNVWKTSNISLSYGATLQPITANITVYSKKAHFIGDSITQGYGTGGPAINDAGGSWVIGVAEAFGCEYGARGFGGLGWNWVSGGGVAYMYDASAPQSWEHLDSNTSMLTAGAYSEGAPDYIFVNMGTNDQNNGVSSSIVQTKCQAWLGAARTVTGAATWIFVIVPFGGHEKTALTAAVSAYKAANPTDTKVALLDLTPTSTYGIAPSNFLVASEYSPDGVHPLSVRNTSLASQVVKSAQAAIGGAGSTPGAHNISLGGIGVA